MLLSLFIFIVVIEIAMTSGAPVNENVDDSLEFLFNEVAILDDSLIEQTLP